MAFYRRRYRRRFYRRYRKYSRWARKPLAASSLKQVSLPIRKTLSVTFNISRNAYLSTVSVVCAFPHVPGAPGDPLVTNNTTFSALAGIFDEVRCKNFGIQITPGLNTGFPPGALLICPDRKYYGSEFSADAPTAEEMLVSPATQVVGFTQFSTLQTRRSVYASTTVERQSFMDVNKLSDTANPFPASGLFSPAFYLAVRLAAAPTTEVSIPCTITMTGVFVFRNPSN